MQESAPLQHNELGPQITTWRALGPFASQRFTTVSGPCPTLPTHRRTDPRSMMGGAPEAHPQDREI